MAIDKDVATLGIGIEVDDADFGRDIDSILGSVKTFATTATKILGSITSGLVTGLAQAGKQFADEFSDITKDLNKSLALSNSYNLPLGQLQALRFAANKAGMSTEILDQSLNHMVRNLGRAQNANNDVRKSLNQMGLSMQQIGKMNAMQQYLSISEAISRLPKEEQSRAAYNLFEETGVKQLAIMRSDIRGALQEFQELGLGASKSQAEMISAFTGAQTAFSAIWTGFKEQIVLNLLEPLTDFIKYLMKVIKELGGVRNAAKMVAQGVLTFFAAMISGVGMLLSSLNTLMQYLDRVAQRWQDIKDLASNIDPMTWVERAQKGIADTQAFLISKMTGGKFVAGKSASNNDSSFYEDNRKATDQIMNIGKGLLNMAKGMKLTKDDIGSTTAQFVSDILASGQTFKQNIADAAAKVTNAFDDILGKNSKKDSDALITKIMEGMPQTTKSDRQDFIQEAQNILMRSIKLRNGVNQFGQGSITDATGKKLAQVQQDAHKVIQEGMDHLARIIDEEKAAGRDPSALITAMGELKGFVSNNPKDQSVTINVISDPHRLVKVVVESAKFNPAVAAGVQNVLSGVAQGTPI